MNGSVLLVETKGNVLEKLQQNSFLQGLNTDIRYTQDSVAAMDMVSQLPVGVVVANFGHNHKDCLDLCRQVHQQTTSFIMLVLLIDEPRDEVASAVKYAHQTLAVSCSEKEIVAIIERGLQASNEARSNPKLAALLSKIDSLPSPPSVYFDLRDQLGLPSCNVAALTTLVLRDQALAAKILRVANSGFYAVPRTILDLHQAITLLGTETLLGLVLATHVFDNLPLPGLNLDNLWKHAIGVGLMARQIAKLHGANREQVEASGIAGLLHDLGSLVFISNQAAEYQAILRKTQGQELEVCEIEKQVFGIDHAELGGFVLMLWGLPDTIVNAVKHHHDYEYQSALVDSSSTEAVVIAEYMFNYSAPLTDKESFIANCPLQCTDQQFDQWCAIFDEVNTKL